MKRSTLALTGPPAALAATFDRHSHDHSAEAHATMTAGSTTSTSNKDVAIA